MFGTVIFEIDIKLFLAHTQKSPTHFTRHPTVNTCHYNFMTLTGSARILT